MQARRTASDPTIEESATEAAPISRPSATHRGDALLDVALVRGPIPDLHPGPTGANGAVGAGNPPGATEAIGTVGPTTAVARIAGVATSAPPWPQRCGAECIFLGRSRGDCHREHGELLRLEYEAYEPMALRLMSDLAEQVAERHDLGLVRVHHALGAVPIGAASVLIQVAAGHRDAAFAACRTLIDRLKLEVPIWKREVWTRSSTWSPPSRPA
ncbi:MAG TPA: molybdenum cofactor biosynthesis protein MoaE [Phycisphaerales bacterium]|nr:molybdenum cofactor biosynthesis protein MoaE [Phycisphaerales bacterium]HMP36750.1 molybdenum cofactor biosynthesis protein MoaE [Phycisphaerales bacterium]